VVGFLVGFFGWWLVFVFFFFGFFFVLFFFSVFFFFFFLVVLWVFFLFLGCVFFFVGFGFFEPFSPGCARAEVGSAPPLNMEASSFNCHYRCPPPSSPLRFLNATDFSEKTPI